MTAAELVATGAKEMFWFQGLLAGNRFELSNEPRAVAIGIARMQPNRIPLTHQLPDHPSIGQCATWEWNAQPGDDELAMDRNIPGYSRNVWSAPACWRSHKRIGVESASKRAHSKLFAPHAATCG